MKYISLLKTKIGELCIIEEENSLTNLYLPGFNIKSIINQDVQEVETDFIKLVKQELLEYFDKNRKGFSFKLNPYGTEFQKKVWNQLIKIPYGSTATYKEIAVAIGNENACRAVGLANNKNPIPIAIPCHRVIGSSGKLVGYAGGLELKKTLLEIESNV